jgi:hypothetical protein
MPEQITVVAGALSAHAGQVDAVARAVGSAASAVGRVGGGDLPPRTGAALRSALAAWPAGLRRLAAALHATAGTLRASDGVYGGVDEDIAGTAGRGGPR